MAKKVVVAMSGGIDSSVAAALLKRAGFNVVGIFMKFWVPSDKKGLAGAWNRCCSPDAEKRAGWVAKSLGIPFYVFNVEKEFKKRIVDYFLAGYKKGITPNPCVLCNKEIKFGLLLKKAFELGADYIATGHYAQIKNGKLFRAKDKLKDQSYFLWQLSKEQLRHVLFPVGSYKKEQVKKLAEKFRLPLFNISESMEICFIQTTINDFLKDYLRPKPGKIVDVKGNVLGKHQGLAFYTIGQRKGIGLASGPYWVLDKDLKNNLLIVTKNEEDLYKKELIAENVNWISDKEVSLPIKVKAKIRYLQNLETAKIYQKEGKYFVEFEKPQRAITPGQSVVFYKGQELVGGGIIS